MSKTGRPPAPEIDWETVDKLCQLQCTSEEIGSVLNISTDTLSRRCRKKFKTSFAEYIAEKRLGGRVSLRRAQWSKALKETNTTMLIWLGKQYLGQTDKLEHQDIGPEKASQVNHTFSVSFADGERPVNEAEMAKLISGYYSKK
jgi:AraC-like DNA-binding protein